MPAITSYPVTGDNAKAFRALNKFGMNLADFAGLTTSSTYDRIGKGGTYTVSNWISDGVFANLAAAQAVYPIIQDGNDQVDWVLLQSAIDFLIYGSLGSSVYGSTKRKLFIPAGQFLINRTLHVGYGELGTPPGDLNASGYVTITIEGEGRQADTTGNGMTGTSILTEAYTYPGMVLSSYQACQLRGFTLRGPGVNWMANNNPIRDGDSWDRAAWRDPAITDDELWIGGDRVNVGIGLDLYSDGTAAAAYPARVLPSYFGGGTTTSGISAAGTTVEIDDVKVMGFVVGIGRVHGDSNGEFYRINNSDIELCVHGFVQGHSQGRNASLTNVNFEQMHTGISNLGGLRNNGNLHGGYQTLHFGRVFQLFEHSIGGWSGPVTFQGCYAESFMRIGTWTDGLVTFQGSCLSFIEQEGTDGVAYNHYDCGHLVLDSTQVSGLRHGLMGTADPNSGNKIEIIKGTSISFSGVTANYIAHANVADITAGVAYMRGIFHRVGGNSRRFFSDSVVAREGYDNNWQNRTPFTFLDQDFTSFYGHFPSPYPDPVGSDAMQGSVQRFPVPKISKTQLSLDVTSRSGFDLVCPRTAIGDIKADVGDVFSIQPPDLGDDALRVWTWFVVVSISGSNMTLRQLSNFDSTTATDYVANGFFQVSAATGYLTEYICTRIRQNMRLFVGDVTAGSAVISNVRFAFQSGTTDQFNDTNFDMTVGDYFLHQEIERSSSTGGVKVHNLVSSIDFTANTITLTQNFNITRNAYPIVFYVKVFNA